MESLARIFQEEALENENIFKEILNRDTIDISWFVLDIHATGQYIIKVSPGKTLQEVIPEIKNRLKKVRALTSKELLALHKFRKDTNLYYERKKIKKRQNMKKKRYFIDEEFNVYVASGARIITTFPIERTFKPISRRTNKMPGYKYL